MQNLQIRAPLTLPFDFEPGRSRTRRRPASAVRRAAAVRNCGQLAATGISEEQVGAWLIQGTIVVVMLAIVAFFHAPLMAAVSSWL